MTTKKWVILGKCQIFISLGVALENNEEDILEGRLQREKVWNDI